MEQLHYYLFFFFGGGGGVKCWIICLNKMIDCTFSNWSIFEKKVYSIVTPDWFSPDQKVATLYESLRLHQYFARHLLYNSHYWHLWCDITVSICVIWTETKSTLCLTFMISQDFFFQSQFMNPCNWDSTLTQNIVIFFKWIPYWDCLNSQYRRLINN